MTPYHAQPPHLSGPLYYTLFCNRPTALSTMDGFYEIGLQHFLKFNINTVECQGCGSFLRTGCQDKEYSFAEVFKKN